VTDDWSDMHDWLVLGKAQLGLDALVNGSLLPPLADQFGHYPFNM